jgi:hypothetical protein
MKDVSIGWSEGYPPPHEVPPPPKSLAQMVEENLANYPTGQSGQVTVADMRRWGMELPEPTRPERLEHGLTEKERGTL